MKIKILKSCVLLATVASIMTGCGATNKTSDEYAAPAATVKSEKAYETANYKMVKTNNESGAGIAYDTYAVETEEMYEYETDDAAAQEDKSQTQNLDSMTLLEEKLVYHCDLDIETLDYAATVTSIKDAITKYNGVIQSEDESDNGRNWYYEDYYKTSGTLHNYIRIRIPSSNYESFLSELDGIGKIVSKSTSVDNISQQYYDTTTQIEALKIQEKNLLAMLEKCETIEDMITVQARLSEVQYELNSLQTTKRYMDIDVAYSYVNISVSEVMEYHEDETPVKTNTFIDRLRNTLESTAEDFLSFLEGLLFLVIHLAPYFVIVAIFGFIFRKKIKQKIADKKADKMAQRAQKELQRHALMQQHQLMKNQSQAQQVSNDELNK